MANKSGYIIYEEIESQICLIKDLKRSIKQLTHQDMKSTNWLECVKKDKRPTVKLLVVELEKAENNLVQLGKFQYEETEFEVSDARELQSMKFGDKTDISIDSD